MKKLFIILLLGLFSFNYVNAQTSTEIVWEQLQNSYSEASDLGYSVKNYIVGGLDADDNTNWTFNFSASKEYIFVAVCDADCEDIDLYLNNVNGEEIDKDTEEDDYPVVTFSPAYSGRYELKVTMYSCEIEPCYFGIGIFEK